MTLYNIVFDVSFNETNYAKTSGLKWNEKSKKWQYKTKVISDNFRVRQLTRLFKISFIHYDNIVDFDSELIKKFKNEEKEKTINNITNNYNITNLTINN